MANKGTAVGKAPDTHVDITQVRLSLRMAAETPSGIWKTVEVGLTGSVTGELDDAFLELYDAGRRQLVALYFKGNTHE